MGVALAKPPVHTQEEERGDDGQLRFTIRFVNGSQQNLYEYYF